MSLSETLLDDIKKIQGRPMLIRSSLDQIKLAFERYQSIPASDDLHNAIVTLASRWAADLKRFPDLILQTREVASATSAAAEDLAAIRDSLLGNELPFEEKKEILRPFEERTKRSVQVWEEVAQQLVNVTRDVVVFEEDWGEIVHQYPSENASKEMAIGLERYSNLLQELANNIRSIASVNVAIRFDLMVLVDRFQVLLLTAANEMFKRRFKVIAEVYEAISQPMREYVSMLDI